MKLKYYGFLGLFSGAFYGYTVTSGDISVAVWLTGHCYYAQHKL